MILTIIILIVGVISYLIDLNTNKYFKEMKGDLGLNLYLLFHHVLASFIILGIFSNKMGVLKVYVLTLLIVFISWYVFKGHCIITLSTNKYCNLDPNIQFKSIFARIYKWWKDKFPKKDKVEVCKIDPESKRCNTEIKKNYNLSQYYIFPILIAIALIRIGLLSKKKN